MKKTFLIGNLSCLAILVVILVPAIWPTYFGSIRLPGLDVHRPPRSEGDALLPFESGLFPVRSGSRLSPTIIGPELDFAGRRRGALIGNAQLQGRYSWIDIREFGATGDGTTDDTVAIQSACTEAFSSSSTPPGTAATVYFPPGTYRVTSPITCGVPGTRTNGFILTGSAGKASEIVYEGEVSGGPLRIINAQWFSVSNLRIRATTRSEFGLWIDADNASSGGHWNMENVAINNFVDGLKIGHLPLKETNGLPGGTYVNTEISDCVNCVHIIGANTDGQFFYGLMTNNCKVVIRGESARNVHVFGGGHSNATSPSGSDSFIYMFVDGGNAGGGGYTLDGIRIEQGVTLAQFGGSGGNEGKQINLNIRNVTHASKRGAVSNTKLLHFNQHGNITIENCYLWSSGGYFHFQDFNSNDFASFRLINNQIVNATPEAPNSLITVDSVSGNSAAGGVTVYMEGNTLLSDRTGFVIGRIKDKVVRITPTGAQADIETVLFNFGEGVRDKYTTKLKMLINADQEGSVSSSPLAIQNGANEIGEYVAVSFSTSGGGKGPHAEIRAINGPDTYDVRLALLSSSDGGATLNEGLAITHRGQTDINVGITQNGGGFKHVRVPTGSILPGSSSAVTVNWTSAFSDTNYTVNCSILVPEVGATALQIAHIESVKAGRAVVRVENKDRAAANSGILHCVAVHD